MTWRYLSDAEKSAVTDNTSAINLMLNKTSVIKRPILEDGNKVLALGFDETTYKQIFK